MVGFYILEYFRHSVKKFSKKGVASLYEIVKKFCEEKGISVFQFERICGCSNGYIRRLSERGHSPSMKLTKRVAQVMGMTVDELIEKMG